jgi:hypothetical protein
VADEIRADPIELAKLADEVHGAADKLTDAVTATAHGLRVPVGALGDVQDVDLLRQACTEAAATAGTVSELLTAIMEGDVDRLYQSAFAYYRVNQAIEEEARKLGNPP